MLNERNFFQHSFHALTDHEPFPWQERLFGLFKRGEIPRSVNLPTATGKTSLIPIWVIALEWQAIQNTTHLSLPRRLIWVVNRRVVVDQASEEAACIADRIAHPEKANEEEGVVLQELRAALGRLSVVGELGEPPLAVSTLRGELADNGAWKVDASRPAIIIGTVDMIGSRLLFSGYGDGRWKRPHHAGLLGQDTLIVHDEAHLAPAFGLLLEGIPDAQTRHGGFLKSFAVIQLSATRREHNAGTFGLKDDDLKHEELKDRLTAKKSLRMHARGKGEQLENKLADLALAYEGEAIRVIVYVRLPDTARKVADKLHKSAPNRVAVLTGTLRGHERDLLIRNPIFRSFLPGLQEQNDRKDTYYLVSTSAGEVGINLDADHMVGDLPTADSLIQQLGRVNRFGHGDAVVDLVFQESDENGPSKKTMKRSEHDKALSETLAYLKRLPSDGKGGYDVSPKSLQDSPPPPEAFSWMNTWTGLPGWLGSWERSSGCLRP